MLKISTKSTISYENNAVTEEDYLKNKGSKDLLLKFKESRLMTSNSKLNIDLQ